MTAESLKLRCQMEKPMLIRDHECNKDPQAKLVWSNFETGIIRSVYSTSKGFVALPGEGKILPGYYATKEQAMEAIGA